ncbi:DrmB family protein [Streptomyces sp. NPDC021224]|uniref:DrmB family protein n=1 Tax=unclassified Streptomyces TaxID=2593676 RepID=UPI00378C8CDF
MTPPPPRRRGAVRPGSPITRLRKLGEIRRAQAVTTYGVGSMIAVDNESFVIAGLDTWDVSHAETLWEPRLTAVTGVREFKLPPAVDLEEARDGVRAVRFPQLYSCPECRELQYYAKFNPPRDKAVCGTCERDLVPSRFVTACVNGHLDDFPYWKWVHRSSSHEPGADGSPGRCGGKLRLRTEGSTASLRGVVVGCTCGVKEVSMEGAFRSQALRELRIRCAGRRPWLKDVAPDPCNELPRTLQRGSSAVWFPVVHSALSIPPWSDGVHKALRPYWNRIKDEDEAMVRGYLRIENFEERNRGLTVDEAVAAVLEAREKATDRPAQEHTTLSSREHLYLEEYRTLQRERPEDARDERQDFVCERPDDERTPDGIGQVMLVKRVREVRALQSFTRVEEPAVGDGPTSPRRAAVSLLRTPEWLPAMEVSGEGVFVRLDPERLAAWERQDRPRERAERVRRHHQALLRERYAHSDRPAPLSPVSPRYLAVHTLAHLLVNEWSLDGGYPAASLRERLYVGDDMAGFLIYTATSDSAGSLGGIVAQGDPERLAASLESALHRASWCSNDPLCSEASTSGADSLNLAACHACVLLPETSCETNNAFLDRVALVGTPDGELPGLF